MEAILPVLEVGSGVILAELTVLVLVLGGILLSYLATDAPRAVHGDPGSGKEADRQPVAEAAGAPR
jgi:hypothetical protein